MKLPTCFFNVKMTGIIFSIALVFFLMSAAHFAHANDGPASPTEQINLSGDTEEISYMPVVKLSWDAPNARLDGTPLPLEEILGYELMVVTGQGASEIMLSQMTEYNFIITEFLNYCFYVRTVDTGYLRSEYSEPVCADYRKAPNPVILRISK